MHYFRFQQHVGMVSAAPLMWPSWLLSLAGRAGAGRLWWGTVGKNSICSRLQCNLNATYGFCEFTSCSERERERATPSTRQRSWDRAHAPISPALPHFNPKQSEVTRQASSSFVRAILEHRGWAGFTQLEPSRRASPKVFNSLLFTAAVKIFLPSRC